MRKIVAPVEHHALIGFVDIAVLCMAVVFVPFAMFILRTDIELVLIMAGLTIPWLVLWICGAFYTRRKHNFFFPINAVSHMEHNYIVRTMASISIIIFLVLVPTFVYVLFIEQSDSAVPDKLSPVKDDPIPLLPPLLGIIILIAGLLGPCSRYPIPFFITTFTRYQLGCFVDSNQ